ncbi:MAG: hypothetical protein GF364_19605 [Candidatus Lokiarchaeota archaeon]|nr:hypothetical protein [Candidatus Lokiarchaeota archaeon]
MALVEKKKEELEEKKEEEKESVYRVYPDMYKNVDYKQKTVDIEVELPGVKKEKIELKALPTWFLISAPRGDGIEYCAQSGFGAEIILEKTTAKYSNGLLKIHAVIKDPLDDAKTIKF